MGEYDVFFKVIGALFIAAVVIRLFKPYFAVSKPLLDTLEKRKTTKKYMIAHNIIGIAFGAVMFLAGTVKDEYKLAVALPALAVIFIVVLITNKLFIGRIWPH